MSPGKARPRTRDRILDAALELFVEQGFTGTTVSDVERRVGLAAGTGSFYRHFPSKEALLRAAVAREVELRMAESHAEREALGLADDATSDFAASAEQVLRDLRRFDRLFHLSLTEGNRVPEVQEAIVTALRGAGSLSWTNDPRLMVSIAALLGFHMFGRLDGGALQTMGEDEFIAALAALMK